MTARAHPGVIARVGNTGKGADPPEDAQSGVHDHFVHERLRNDLANVLRRRVDD
jgi:hypothetical protein